jgi:hypothetical protein
MDVRPGCILAAVVALLMFALQGELTPAEFERLHSTLVPKAEEKWQTIPWKVDLLEARSIAAKEGKRLFLWSMNGHPLGCT